MKTKFGFLGIFVLLMGIMLSCSSKKKPQTLEERAKELSQKFIIADGHIDFPWRLHSEGKWLDASKDLHSGNFDAVRARMGGLNAPFMSIYVPADYTSERGKVFADSLIDLVEKMCTESPESFALARSPKDVDENFREGKISLPMGMENGSPIGNDLKNLDYFYERGIRYITLAHSKCNQICDSSYDRERKWQGLSPFGVQVVERMNQLGIMVDVAHLSDKSIEQILKISKAPVIASHSSCRKFTPGWERNLSDSLIVAIAKKGGVVMVNFGNSFLDGYMKDQNKQTAKRRREYAKKISKKSQAKQDSLLKQFDLDNPKLTPDVSKVADHIEHIVQIAGIDFVGIGSDFDGVEDNLPIGLKDVSQYPNLILELLQRGFSDVDIEKICFNNLRRVWTQVEQISQHE